MKRDGAIDGWRGVSVLLVIIGHLVGFRFAETFRIVPFREALAAHPVDVAALVKHVLVNFLAPLSLLGVNIFFVISGFLITSLLWSEERRNARISIAAFYVRRIGRIVPAFAVYMLALFALREMRAIAVEPQSFAYAGLYLCNISVTQCGWWLAHTWSLSVEEQFYIVWPLLFLVTPARGAECSAGGAARPVLRAVVPPFNDLISFALIVFGALYASSELVRAQLARFFATRWILLAILMLFIQPFGASSIVYPAIQTTKPLLVGLIFFATIAGVGPLVPVVRWRWLQLLGLVSYSVYLWQQLSTGPVGEYTAAPPLLIPVLFLVPALLSYFLVERPIIPVAHRLSERLKERVRRAQALSSRS